MFNKAIVTRLGAALVGGIMLCSASANASLITFNAVGDPSVSGFVQFDDTNFTGFISNTDITALSLTVMGFSFNFGDVVASDNTVIGAGPIISNGGGALAFNGTETIAFFPDGFGGTAFDGDASLALDTDGTFDFGGGGWESFKAVQWQVQVPEPGTLAIFGLGLLGLGIARRRKGA